MSDDKDPLEWLKEAGETSQYWGNLASAQNAENTANIARQNKNIVTEQRLIRRALEEQAEREKERAEREKERQRQQDALQICPYCAGKIPKEGAMLQVNTCVHCRNPLAWVQDVVCKPEQVKQLEQQFKQQLEEEEKQREEEEKQRQIEAEKLKIGQQRRAKQKQLNMSFFNKLTKIERHESWLRTQSKAPPLNGHTAKYVFCICWGLAFVFLGAGRGSLFPSLTGLALMFVIPFLILNVFSVFGKKKARRFAGELAQCIRVKKQIEASLNAERSKRLAKLNERLKKDWNANIDDLLFTEKEFHRLVDSALSPLSYADLAAVPEDLDFAFKSGEKPFVQIFGSVDFNKTNDHASYLNYKPTRKKPSNTIKRKSRSLKKKTESGLSFKSLGAEIKAIAKEANQKLSENSRDLKKNLVSQSESASPESHEGGYQKNTTIEIKKPVSEDSVSEDVSITCVRCGFQKPITNEAKGGYVECGNCGAFIQV